MLKVGRREAVIAMMSYGAPFAVRAQESIPSDFNGARESVKNRGKPPVAFLNELVAWGRQAPDEIFTVNAKEDIYSRVFADLGPWKDDRHRRAVMLEVLRVLGGFESSWDWNAEVDTSNPSSNTPCTREAGIFQCSADSMRFSPKLKSIVIETGGDAKCGTFTRITKENHLFAIDYCARLLRETVRHHGPVRDGHINQWLRRDAVQEFLSRL